MQKRFARLITRSDRRIHSSPLFKQLNWMPITENVNHHSMIKINKSMNGMASELLETNFNSNNDRRNSRLGRHLKI